MRQLNQHRSHFTDKDSEAEGRWGAWALPGVSDLTRRPEPHFTLLSYQVTMKCTWVPFLHGCEESTKTLQTLKCIKPVTELIIQKKTQFDETIGRQEMTVIKSLKSLSVMKHWTGSAVSEVNRRVLTPSVRTETITDKTEGTFHFIFRDKAWRGD